MYNGCPCVFISEYSFEYFYTLLHFENGGCIVITRAIVSVIAVLNVVIGVLSVVPEFLKGIVKKLEEIAKK